MLRYRLHSLPRVSPFTEKRLLNKREEAAIQEVMEKLEEFLIERDWEKFHDPKNLAMSISIEAAELMELFQWLTTEEAIAESKKPELRERIKEEIADVMLYCFSLARIIDIDVSQAMLDKIRKNKKKYPAELFHGIARKYNTSSDRDRNSSSAS